MTISYNEELSFQSHLYFQRKPMRKKIVKKYHSQRHANLKRKGKITSPETVFNQTLLVFSILGFCVEFDLGNVASTQGLVQELYQSSILVLFIFHLRQGFLKLPGWA